MASTDYGDISPRTAVYASKRLLKRALPYLVLENFGQPRPLSERKSRTIVFRRFDRFPITPSPITEGVTPSARQLQTTDITANLDQYGDRIQLTDVVMDTHEDPVMQEGIDVLGEQAAQMLEVVRFYALRGGTNVFYSGTATARNAVVGTLTLDLQRRITRQLKRQDARKITRIVRSTPSYATQNVNAAYVCVCHSDLENEIRELRGFVPVEDYGQIPPYENEVGKVEDIRYLTSTIFEPWENAGADISGDNAPDNPVISTGGSRADVYPLLYIGADAYGIVPFKGKNAVTPMIVNPKPSDSDPLAQRCHMSWKAYQTAVILNDAWMVRAEVAVSA